MIFDDLLGLPHVDWAQIESRVKKPAATPRKKQRRKPSRRHP
jgi:beta-lactamase class C